MEWQRINTAPFDRDLELAVIDYDGVHALAFACRASSAAGSKWEQRNGSTFNRPIGGNGRIHANSSGFSFLAGHLAQPA